jgi:hypothetical protein
MGRNHQWSCLQNEHPEILRSSEAKYLFRTISTEHACPDYHSVERPAPVIYRIVPGVADEAAD